MIDMIGNQEILVQFVGGVDVRDAVKRGPQRVAYVVEGVAVGVGGLDDGRRDFASGVVIKGVGVS
jgi:hypothetical protein